MRTKNLAPSVLLAAALGALGACDRLPSDADQPLQPRQSATSGAQEVDGLRQDAEAYAARYGVSVDEALRRLQLQSAAGELDALLQTEHLETFAGLVIEHEPSFEVVARFTRGGAEALSAAVRDPTLAAVVRAERAVVPRRQLERRLEVAYARVRGRGIEASGGLNLRENRPEIYVRAAVAAAARAAIPAETGATVVIVDRLPALEAPFLQGGLALSTCTSGYFVTNSSGTQGISTAGHCGSNQSHAGYVLTFQNELDSASYDIQWHTRADAGYDASINDVDGSSDRPIYATRVRSEQSSGTWVCKKGMTTGLTCGTISTNSYCLNGACTWLFVSGGSVNLSEGGDSGSPWFSGNTAYGSHVFGAGNDAGYMAIDFFSGIGVSIVTQPPPPPPQMSVTILGPTTAPAFSVVTVQASVQNSSATPFSYAWKVNNAPKPNCPTYQNWCSQALGGAGISVFFSVVVTDANGQQASDYHVVTAQ